ncbi:hypothetical protein [Streptomyces sp. NPDC056160]|uniref:hypothetical protein n=1 Tax=Streptomyces sp. NPDC056160 TaxID=3345731 RepID=UPI0035DE8D49
MTGPQHPVRALVLLPALEDDEVRSAPPFTWSRRFTATSGAGANARLQVRPRLTVARWCGDIEAAARITDALMNYAVRTGQPFDDGCVVLRLTVDTTGALLIEVEDAGPDVPYVENVDVGTGIRISWCLKKEDGAVVGRTAFARISAELTGGAA